MRLKLMTYNVHSGKDAYGRLDMEGIARVIADVRPDICVLNEVRVDCPTLGACDQAALYGERTNMDYRFAKAIDLPEGGVYGIAMLSRLPFKEFNVYPVPQLPPEQREKRYEDRVVEMAVIDVNGTEIAVYGSHFGLSRGEQANACQLVETLIKQEKRPAVFMGDLNVEPDNEVIARIGALLTDTDPAHALTHHSINPVNTIDYIFTDGHFTTQRAYTIKSEASDHLPRISEVDLVL